MCLIYIRFDIRDYFVISRFEIPRFHCKFLHNSLTTKKQTIKCSSANFQKKITQSYIILRTQRLEGKQCRLDEVAHNEPPHQDLRCLQIQLFSSVVLKELIEVSLKTGSTAHSLIITNKSMFNIITFSQRLPASNKE